MHGRVLSSKAIIFHTITYVSVYTDTIVFNAKWEVARPVLFKQVMYGSIQVTKLFNDDVVRVVLF